MAGPITHPAATAIVFSNGGTMPNPNTEPVLPRWRLIVLTGSMSFGLFLSLLDTTIVATALYTIGVDFGALNTVNWVALAYTLSYLGCVVIFARVGDIIGRRNAYIGAFLIFFAFSLGCGFAQSLSQLIACRALQGIGGSGLYSLTMVIFPEITPLEKSKYLGGIIGAVVAMSGILGPLLGGAITHSTTWRWVFWINAPIGILPLIAFCIAWPKPNQIRHPRRRSFRDLDIVSCLLHIVASVLVVFSLQEGGIHTNAWNTALFLAPLIIGCVCWVSLFSWEFVVDRLWTRLMTIFPLRLFRNRVYLSAVIATMLTGYSYFVIIYSLPLRFQVVNAKSALAAGIGLLPMLGSTAAGSVIGGAVSSTKNRTFHSLFAGACLMVIGTGLLSTLENTTWVQPKTYGFLVFAGLGFGLTVSTASILSTVESELQDQAVAQGIVAQCRILGGTIGIAASTAILGVKERQQLSGVVSQSQLASLQASVKTLSLTQLNAVRQAYSDAFSEDLRVCAIIAGICVLATLGTFQKNPLGIRERRRQQYIDEARRARNEKSGGTVRSETRQKGTEMQPTSVV